MTTDCQSTIETVRANWLARDGVPPPRMLALTTAPQPSPQVRANRLARDGVIEDRSAPSQMLPPKEIAHVPLPLQYRPPSTARRSNRSASPKSKRSARKQLKSR
jgi:hypothetical protein